ncbi:MAG: hypothetical protein R8P61_16055 [Bacteroidia bacterium]|nr:hypothetical protein [Bacteroidia bacterium]
MKVLLKSSIKYIAALTLMLGMAQISFAQEERQASQRLIDAEQELYELIQVDKRSLTKEEKQIWKKQKKYLQRIISEEKDKDEFYTYRRNRDRFNNYNPYYGRYGYYSPFFYRYPRRIIVVRR